MRMVMVVFTAAVLLTTAATQSEQRPMTKEARGYCPLPKATVQPDKARDFKVIFDATRLAAKPQDFVPALATNWEMPARYTSGNEDSWAQVRLIP